MEPLVYIVIVNWNGRHFLKDCLDSVYRQRYRNFKVVIVDNGSTDGSQEFVKKTYKKTVFIKLPKNVGFAEANNVGFRYAFRDKKTKYVAILNNDTKVNHKWIGEMVRAIEKDEKIGTCACKILRWNTPNTIDTVGIVIYKSCTTAGRGPHEPKNNYNKQEEIFGAAGAAALYSREMLNDIRIGDNYFDSDYFIYQEEFDLSWRAFINGWKCVYVPTSVVYHKGSGTMGKMSKKSKYLLERNRIWTIIKNLQRGTIMYSMPHIIIYEILSLPFYIASGHFLTVIKARTYALLHAGHMFQKRQKIQKKTTDSSRLIRIMQKRNYIKDLKMNM